MATGLKRRIFDRIQRSGLYPHIYFVGSPFKIYEFRMFEKWGDIQPDDIVLDIGCGWGLQTALLARNAAKVIGIDVSEDAVNRARSEQHLLDKRGNIEWRAVALEDAGFQEGQFDKIFSVCVLEHIEEDEPVLREAFRVLKPGGRLVLSIDSLATIADEEARRQHAEKYWVRRYYTPASIREKLQRAGFSDIVIEPFLCSPRAARWFTEAIRRDFAFRYSEAVWKYGVLKIRETLNRKHDQGVYLMICASKPNQKNPARTSGGVEV